MLKNEIKLGLKLPVKCEVTMITQLIEVFNPVFPLQWTYRAELGDDICWVRL